MQIDSPSKIASLDEIKSLKKTELHLHLGGAWPISFLEQVATPEEFAQLERFLDMLDSGMNYHEGFAAFDLINKIVNTEERLYEGSKALCAWLADDNVMYTEVRTGLKDLGNGYEAYLQAVLKGLREGDALHGIQTPLMVSLRRNTPVALAKETLRLAIKYRDQGICGFDISGDSTLGDAHQLLETITKARSEGFAIALHQGESEEECPTQQLWELENFLPSRLGHGVYLGAEAMDYITHHRISLEICLRSSELTGMVEQHHHHPGVAFLTLGKPFCISTDDPTVFRTSLSEELHRFAVIHDLSMEQIKDLQQETEELRFS